MVCRYEFTHAVALDSVELTVLLSYWATEALHGTRCDAGHYFSTEERKLVIDATTPAGRDFRMIVEAFLEREWGGEFQVYNEGEPPPSEFIRRSGFRTSYN